MTDRRAIYRVKVDWSNSGDLTFPGTYDDVIADVLAEPGVIISGIGRDQSRGLSPPQEPTLDVSLNNRSRRYASENTESPLTGSLLPGRDVRVTMQRDAPVTWDDSTYTWDDASAWWDGAETVNLFTGDIEELPEDPALGARSVTLHASGRLAKLRSLYVATPLYQNITTGQAMGSLFAAAGLGTADYWIDPDAISNGRVFSYWYVDGGDVASEAIKIWNSEGYSASLEEDGDGVISFYGRNYRTLTTRSQESQATFYDTPGTLFHTTLRYVPGMRDIVNYPYVSEVILRSFQSLGTIWQYSNAVTLNSAGGGTVTARVSEPFAAAVTPVVTTDFTLSAGTVSVSLSRTSGKSTDVIFTGGTPGASVSSLALRGSLFAARGTIQATSLINTSVSRATYGQRQLALDAWEGLSPTDAVSLCDGIVLAYQTPRAAVEIEIINADDAHLHQIFDRRTGDRIHVIEEHSGIDLDLTIEQIQHRIVTGRLHSVVYGCEKVVESDWALYDVSLYGTGVFGQ